MRQTNLFVAAVKSLLATLQLYIFGPFLAKLPVHVSFVELHFSHTLFVLIHCPRGRRLIRNRVTHAQSPKLFSNFDHFRMILRGWIAIYFHKIDHVPGRIFCKIVYIWTFTTKNHKGNTIDSTILGRSFYKGIRVRQVLPCNNPIGTCLQGPLSRSTAC